MLVYLFSLFEIAGMLVHVLCFFVNFEDLCEIDG